MKLLSFLVFLLATTLAFAGYDTETDKDGIILNGYDAVAYVTVNKALPGDPNITFEHNEAIYQFVSEENRDLFKADPEKYVPQYGGYCAFAMSFGKKVSVNGEAFHIKDGKTYVNKNLKIYKRWKKDIPGNIAKADVKWPEVEFKKP